MNAQTSEWKATPLHLALAGNNDVGKVLLLVVLLLKAGGNVKVLLLSSAD